MTPDRMGHPSCTRSSRMRRAYSLIPATIISSSPSITTPGKRRRYARMRFRADNCGPPGKRDAPRSRSMWWPRRNAPVTGLAWKTSRASASGYGLQSPNGPPTPAGRSRSRGSSSRTRPAGRGCRWCTSIRRTPPAPAPNAATSTKRTGSLRPVSRAGTADSLITLTGTAPATSAPARKSCGDAGRSQPPQTRPRQPGAGQDASAAPQPVAPAVQARDFSPGSLTLLQSALPEGWRNAGATAPIGA